MAEPRQLRSASLLLPLLGAFALFAVAGVALLLFTFDGDDEAAPAATEARLVFAEFGPTADRIYVARASRLEERDRVATVRHASGWGINPATEMAGSLVAFTVLPSDAPPRRDSPAELWLLDVARGDLTRLASDADLLAAPVFDRGGRHLAYRRSTAEGAQALVRVDLGSRARSVPRRPPPRGQRPRGRAAPAARPYASRIQPMKISSVAPDTVVRSPSAEITTSDSRPGS